MNGLIIKAEFDLDNNETIDSVLLTIPMILTGILIK